MKRTWYALDFNDLRVEGSVKFHVVPDELVETVVADLKERGSPFVRQNVILKVGIDYPGMVHRDDVWYDFQLDGIVAQFSARSFEGMLKQLRELPKRIAPSGMWYFKLHGFLNCLVLTPKNRVRLLDLMAPKLQEALVQAELEAQRFNEAFVKNSHSNVRVEPRHVPRRRGVA